MNPRARFLRGKNNKMYVPLTNLINKKTAEVQNISDDREIIKEIIQRMIIKTSIPCKVEDWGGIDNILEKYITADPGRGATINTLISMHINLS